MSMTLMAQAMSIKVGNPIRKLVLIKLADNANDKGECWPSYQHIADQCEIGRSTVKSHIKALEDMGLVRKEFRKKGLLNQSNLFYLNFNNPSTDASKVKTVRNKAAEMVESKPGKGVGQDLTGVGHEMTGVGQELPEGGSGVDRGGRSGTAPITSHSFEPVIEPKNNTHKASCNYESVGNFTAPPPHRSDTQMQTGKGGKIGACSSLEPPAPERKTRSTQARHKNPVLQDAIERVKTQIAMKTREVQLREASPACRNKLAAEHRSEKFIMFEGWRPSPELSRTARKIGINLSGPPDQARLADFVTFWEADGAAYNQIQWEMKLARSLKNQRHRAHKRHRPGRDFMAFSGMDYTIPEGFRG